MKNYIDKLSNRKLGIFLTFIFLFTITQQFFFKENHVLLIYGLKDLIYFNNLKSDWVTDYTNHIPIYTSLTFLLSKFFTVKSLYILYYILLFLCTYSLFAMFNKNYQFNKSQIILWFLLFIILFHEKSYFTGVAGQAVINQTLQPASFGIFFFISLAFYFHSKIFFSIFFLCIAVYFHPTYLIHSMFFVAGYLVHNFVIKKNIIFFKIILIYSCLILPVIFFLHHNFIINEANINLLAQKILIEERIPHHAKISHWLSYKDFISIGIIFVGLFLIRTSNFFFIPLLVICILSLSISLIQYFTDNYFIALLFPWRTSVFLIPISSLIIISHLVKRINLNIKFATSLFLIVYSLFFIKNILVEEKFNKKLNNKNDLFVFLKSNEKIDLLIIPTYMEDIRLNTSVPVFVNWKLHAFKNNEIIEWHKRIKIVNSFYGSENANQQLSFLKKINFIQGTSHILLDKSKQNTLLINCKIINSSDNYILYNSNTCKS